MKSFLEVYGKVIAFVVLVAGVILGLVPALISARDDLAVGLGFLLLVASIPAAVWLFKSINIEKYNKENKVV